MRFVVPTIAVLLVALSAFPQEPAACAPVAPVPLVSPTVLGDGTPGSVTPAQIQAALDGGGHVRFDVGPAPATIDVTSELIVTRAAVLDGGGTVTLSGRGLNRVLRVRGALIASQAYLFGLQNITIADGATPTDDGAGLLAGVDGDWRAVDVRVVNVTFRNNVAIEAAQDGGGGAIYAVGARALLIAGSTFEGNRGSNGGAVYSLGTPTVTILGSLFRDNTATGTGGNPGNGGNAGAIGVDGGQRTVTICRTRLTLRNVVLAFNTGGNAFNPWNISRTVAGSHVIQYPRYRVAPAMQEDPVAVATSLLWADPQVLAPAWNGGPTRTVAILPASAARDAGTATGAPTTDQRGVLREGAPDLGAYEVSSDMIFTDGFEAGA